MEDCTIAQIDRAAKDLSISRSVLPYLYAAFLGRSEFDSLRVRIPDVAWDEVKERIERITDELPYEELSVAHFHDSWRSDSSP